MIYCLREVYKNRSNLIAWIHVSIQQIIGQKSSASCELITMFTRLYVSPFQIFDRDCPSISSYTILEVAEVENRIVLYTVYTQLFCVSVHCHGV